jgi:hypothetical protein
MTTGEILFALWSINVFGLGVLVGLIISLRGRKLNG